MAARSDWSPVRLTPTALEELLESLGRDGYRLVGPTLRDGAIVLDDIEPASLPFGAADEQAPGRYRVDAGAGTGAWFGYAVGPASFKRFLFPPHEELWRAQRAGSSFTVRAPDRDERPLALIGVRPCDAHALRVLDRVLTGGAHVDERYDARRRAAFIVAVECTRPAATCFCTSTGTGPDLATGSDVGVDLVLTEVTDPEHSFLARATSERGAARLAAAGAPSATDELCEAGAAAVTEAAERMDAVRRLPLDATGLQAALATRLEHPHWDDVARRCLACQSCTLVCPTCFCAAVEDHTTLDGTAVRSRRWDSCFTLAHSFIHGGSIRTSTRARYRQWLTHKFGTWWDQFDTSGCVGCGRCVTWCPAGIDVVDELTALTKEPVQ